MTTLTADSLLEDVRQEGKEVKEVKEVKEGKEEEKEIKKRRSV